MNMSTQLQQQKQGRSSSSELITIIDQNDVLLGRGNHVHNPGNAKFRELVLSRSVEYWSCNNNITKDAIARQIIDKTISLGGRFLRKKRNGSHIVREAAAEGATDEIAPVIADTWERADAETILIKVKQTFRDFTASSKKRAAIISRNSQSTTSLPNLLRPSSVASRESIDVSNVLDQVATMATSASNLESGDLSRLSSAAMIHSNHDARSAALSMIQAARTSPMDRLNEEFKDPSTDTQLLEMLARQRVEASLQRHFYQQQFLGQESNLLMNANHQRNDHVSSFLYSNALQDQLLIRRLLLQQTQHQSFPDLSMLETVNRQRLTSNWNVNPSHSMQFANNLGDLNLARLRQLSQYHQQLSEGIDTRNFPPATHQAVLPSTLSLDTNLLRRLSAPAIETSFLPNDTNTGDNLHSTIVANVLAHRNGTASTATTNLALPPADAKNDGKDDDSDDDVDDKNLPVASNVKDNSAQSYQSDDNR